jgi:hypothetical protein
VTAPLSAYRGALRKDPRGWQIEDDAVAERTLQALEIFGLVFAEVVLHRVSRLNLDPGDNQLDLALRGLGTLSGRVAMSRLAWLTGIDETGAVRRDRADEAEAEAVGERMRAVLAWLLEWDLTDPDAPPQLRPPSPPPASVRLALSELHAAAMYLDRRARGQGTTGPGRRRSMVRTTTRRTSDHGR